MGIFITLIKYILFIKKTRTTIPKIIFVGANKLNNLLL